MFSKPLKYPIDYPSRVDNAKCGIDKLTVAGISAKTSLPPTLTVSLQPAGPTQTPFIPAVSTTPGYQVVTTTQGLPAPSYTPGPGITSTFQFQTFTPVPPQLTTIFLGTFLPGSAQTTTPPSPTVTPLPSPTSTTSTQTIPSSTTTAPAVTSSATSTPSTTTTTTTTTTTKPTVSSITLATNQTNASIATTTTTASPLIDYHLFLVYANQSNALANVNETSSNVISDVINQLASKLQVSNTSIATKTDLVITNAGQALRIVKRAVATNNDVTMRFDVTSNLTNQNGAYSTALSGSTIKVGDASLTNPAVYVTTDGEQCISQPCQAGYVCMYGYNGSTSGYNKQCFVDARAAVSSTAAPTNKLLYLLFLLLLIPIAIIVAILAYCFCYKNKTRKSKNHVGFTYDHHNVSYGNDYNDNKSDIIIMGGAGGADNGGPPSYNSKSGRSASGVFENENYKGSDYGNVGRGGIYNSGAKSEAGGNEDRYATGNETMGLF
ncbi:hypothetical protein HELRODRAFT_180467 [Helobdella robusta]|uniref:Uncharacterized protein n=1 Tax=Helobdella robusta TaxID=6412 RepID=T1FFY6_HELRO|nr:hypothetical protein HELRODRAFT_180467 [Helobdella robusta]ESN93816.1 hypothetical protein HELRODRAFT_180467 [Helobdella robusta]